jgi:D-alanyl-D-alanine carboxypeptidase
MSLGRVCSQRRRRWGVLVLASLLALAITTTADARRRHRYNPPSSSIVVDANSGKVLEASHADARRHPASLTKIMTLYLLFEQLEAGKIKLTTEMPVSAHAAAQAPSKLGLKPGQTIDVATAIHAIVTKSANDVAVIVAEAIGGTETEFARMMTAKARALGMRHTNYHNASGLPDDRQITTARDQALLGRAIRDRFPKYFHYFSTRAFTWHGKRMRNHNHLLGRVSGVDGIKTGYIHDSGFNIVTSVHRGGRRIVVVVFGGRSGRARDARAVQLIAKTIRVAATKRTAPLVVERGRTRIARPIPHPPERPPIEQKVAAAAPLPAPAPKAEPTPDVASKTAANTAPATPAPGSTDPITPNPVKTIAVTPGPVHAASLAPLPLAGRTLQPAPASAGPAKITTIATVKSDTPAALLAKPAAQDKPAGTVKLASAGEATPVKAAAQELAAKPRGDWLIQVGAFDVEHDAKQRLTIARKKAKAQLGEANPYTEPVAKGAKTLYRARFAGLDKPQAVTACRHLKRSDIPCFVLRN